MIQRGAVCNAEFVLVNQCSAVQCSQSGQLVPRPRVTGTWTLYSSATAFCSRPFGSELFSSLLLGRVVKKTRGKGKGAGPKWARGMTEWRGLVWPGESSGESRNRG